VSLPQKNPLPQPSFPIADTAGRTTQAFWQYFAKLDALVSAIAGGNAPALVNAANDAAAAKAGVAVGEFYRNGSVLMVRVV
jgi:AcrR family transcriptional regulator